MRKITLFLAMMVAMITTAMAQEPLTATASPQGTVSKIWGDGDVKITFNKPVEYTEPEGGLKIVNANNEVVSNVYAMNFNTDKTNGPRCGADNDQYSHDGHRGLGGAD